MNGELINQSNEQIEEAINYGQALGAINCLFDGARGAMYSTNIEKFESLVNNVINNQLDIELIHTSEKLNKYTYSDVEQLFNSI